MSPPPKPLAYRLCAERYTQHAEWVPRLLYGLMVLWMAYRNLTGGGFMPRVAKDV